MKSLFKAAALSLLIMQPLTAADSVQRYRLEMDVYVFDDMALCEQAMELAVRDHGQLSAESMTMERGQFVPAKCVSIVFQKFHPAGVIGAGIEVNEAGQK